MVKEHEIKPDDFTGCADLPMLNFIKITVTGDLKWLGNCAEPEKLWESIYSEYCELSGDIQSSHTLDLSKQITYLTNRINITNSIVNALSLRGRIDALVDELKSMGYRLQYTDLEKDLQRTLSLSKSDHIKLAVVKEKYSKLETGEKTTEFQWTQILASIAMYKNVVSINPAAISVSEYIAMDKQFRAHCEAMNKINK